MRGVVMKVQGAGGTHETQPQPERVHRMGASRCRAPAPSWILLSSWVAGVTEGFAHGRGLMDTPFLSG